MDVLVAEDEAVSRQLISYTLQQLGYTVHTANDGEEAWEMYQRRRFPVVITDWEMPRLGGLELTDRIRNHRARGKKSPAYTYIILLTGAQYETHMPQAIERGADDFIEKPFSQALLQARLTVARRHAMFANLSAAVPVCMSCKAVKDDAATWMEMEEYFGAAGGIDFSHGYCPACYYLKSLEPELIRLVQVTSLPTARTPFSAERMNELIAKVTEEDEYMLEDIQDSFRDLFSPVLNDPHYLTTRHGTHQLQAMQHLCFILGASELSALLTQVSKGEVNTCSSCGGLTELHAQVEEKVKEVSEALLALELTPSTV